MTDTLPKYRHHQSVPTRVDAAWLKGYEAGRAEKHERLAIVAVIVGTLVLLRTHLARWGVAFLPWALVAALVIIPLAVLVVACVFTCREIAHLITWARHNRPEPPEP